MINKVTLIGNVGQDPDVRSFENGKMAKFSLATNESYKDKNGEKQKKTEWHNIVVFGKTVDVIEKYVNKGDMLYVEGKIQTRTYEKDGETKYITQIIVYNIQMLGGKKTETSNDKPSEKKDNNSTGEKVDTESDDLPF